MTSIERALIDKLLSVPFPGRKELQEQAYSAYVKINEDPEDSSILLAVDPSTPPAPVLQTVPVDARGADVDGVQIDLNMHVGQDRRLTELEIYRVDGEPVRRLPDPELLRITVYPIQG